MDTLVFVKAAPKDIKKYVPLINDVSETKQFKADKTTIMTASLPFYKGTQLLEVMDHDSFPLIKRRFVYQRETSEITPIDYKESTLKHLNKHIPISLDETSATEYIRFYFEMVIGSYGRFYVVENIDDIPWLEDPTPQLRKSMNSLVQDVRLLNADKGTYKLKASILFKSTLFETEIALEQDGTVTILSQDVLLEDMPVHDQALGH